MPPRPSRKPPTRQELIAAIRGVVEAVGRPVSRNEFRRRTKFNHQHINPIFGSYNALVAAAGFKPHTENQRKSDDTLLHGLRDSWLKAGGPVSRKEFARSGPYPIRSYSRRWRTWKATLAAFSEWLRTHDPDFPHMPGLVHERKAEDIRDRRRSSVGRKCGPLLNFRGCLHTTSEQGVVLLFGMVATELDFMIETVSTSFPDCEAKRFLDGLWHRVRIEFELTSRNFALHGHDAAACDLIVCWEHDWPGCPLEVLELKTAVERLRGTPQ